MFANSTKTDYPFPMKLQQTTGRKNRNAPVQIIIPVTCGLPILKPSSDGRTSGQAVQSFYTQFKPFCPYKFIPDRVIFVFYVQILHPIRYNYSVFTRKYLFETECED